MRFLLTSAGITNTSIDNALVDLLGKPTAESNPLCIPTATHAANWAYTWVAAGRDTDELADAFAGILVEGIRGYATRP